MAEEHKTTAPRLMGHSCPAGRSHAETSKEICLKTPWAVSILLSSAVEGKQSSPVSQSIGFFSRCTGINALQLEAYKQVMKSGLKQRDAPGGSSLGSPGPPQALLAPEAQQRQPTATPLGVFIPPPSSSAMSLSPPSFPFPSPKASASQFSRNCPSVSTYTGVLVHKCRIIQLNHQVLSC